MCTNFGKALKDSIRRVGPEHPVETACEFAWTGGKDFHSCCWILGKGEIHSARKGANARGLGLVAQLREGVGSSRKFCSVFTHMQNLAEPEPASQAQLHFAEVERRLLKK